MKAKEIEQLLKSGAKLVYQHNAYFMPTYYIAHDGQETRINAKQFEKWKSLCKHSIDNKHTKWFRGQSYSNYYWFDLEDQNEVKNN